MGGRVPKGRGTLRGITGDTAADVARIFSDEQIDRLAKIAKLPTDANLQDFAKLIRDAAHLFIEGHKARSSHEMRHELVILANAVSSPRPEQMAVVAAFESLSIDSTHLLQYLSRQRTDARRKSVVVPGLTELTTPDTFGAAAKRFGGFWSTVAIGAKESSEPLADIRHHGNWILPLLRSQRASTNEKRNGS